MRNLDCIKVPKFPSIILINKKKQKQDLINNQKKIFTNKMIGFMK